MSMVEAAAKDLDPKEQPSGEKLALVLLTELRNCTYGRWVGADL